jgi:DNA-binding NarL/FixJ family response regulator
MAAAGHGMTAIRVVVVDDHPIVRDGLRALFDSVADVEVAGEAADAEGALREVTVLRPDVLLLDIHMPGETGLEVLTRIRRASPETHVLLLTMDDDADTVLDAVRLGADGYLVKGASQPEIMRAVRAVHDGQMILGPSVNRHLRELPRREAAAPFPELAAREREILDLVAAGLSNAAIAERLFLSPKTVANYLTSVFAKLAVTDRGQAIIRARDAGLGRG